MVSDDMYMLSNQKQPSCKKRSVALEKAMVKKDVKCHLHELRETFCIISLDQNSISSSESGSEHTQINSLIQHTMLCLRISRFTVASFRTSFACCILLHSN